MALKTIPARVASRIRDVTPEREIFLRAGGNVRFLRISTRMQLSALLVAAGVLVLWLGMTLALVWNQVDVAVERSDIAHSRQLIAQKAAQAKADRRSVNDAASDLEARQDALDAIVRSHFGIAVDAKTSGENAPPRKVSALTSTHTPSERFARIKARQIAFEAKIKQAAQARMARVEKAIRSFGLNPAKLTARADRAMGGPFEPAPGAHFTEPALRDLVSLLGRLSSLETTLAGIPSSRPTSAPMVTSSYGYRRDPFNGMTAFHAGIDFPGADRAPILAAASGKVSYVGQRSGYGNVVEIDHGGGIMTRYAHLSGFTSHVGEAVSRGQQIARMGSTGRSTGTHLHFEVRVNGAAVDPRPFLEARKDVLEVQQFARRRTSGRHGG